MTKKYRIRFSPSLGLTYVLFRGKIELSDMLAYLEELYTSKAFDPDLPMVYDFRGSIAIGYRMEVFTFLDKLKQYRPIGSKPKKIAAIVDGLNQRFLGKIFIKLAQGLNMDMEMFDFPEDCVHWLSEDPAYQKTLLELILNARSEQV